VSETILPEELEGRVDLRQELTVTIDGADAKDLDDAVALVKREDGTFVLTVSIADVSYYVTENSEMDKEAFERGTSVYLTDRVVPMLPQRLSNGICSLHPYEERLTMSCRMEIDRSGTIYQYEIFPSIIRSDMRLTYSLVNELYEKKEVEIPDEIQQMLLDMKELHHILERRRKERGAIDFETHEAKIIVDEQGAPIDIQIRERGIAERLIESFMLAANETVAMHYQRRNVPFIYRVHEQPQQEKMQRFLEFVTAFGINIKGTSDTISPKKLQKALDEAEAKAEKEGKDTRPIFEKYAKLSEKNRRKILKDCGDNPVCYIPHIQMMQSGDEAAYENFSYLRLGTYFNNLSRETQVKLSDFVELENGKTRNQLPKSVHYATLALGAAEAVGLGGIALTKLPKGANANEKLPIVGETKGYRTTKVNLNNLEIEISKQNKHLENTNEYKVSLSNLSLLV